MEGFFIYLNTTNKYNSFDLERPAKREGQIYICRNYGLLSLKLSDSRTSLTQSRTYGTFYFFGKSIYKYQAPTGLESIRFSLFVFCIRFFKYNA